MPTAALADATITYDDTGGPGPVVVLAHGLLMDRTMFEPQVEALRDRFRVVTWDARGFGDTTWDGGPFTYWDLAADCLGLLDHLGVERAVVGGMSQGGFISLRVALSAPERVAALVFIDSQAGAEEEDAIALYKPMIDDWVTNGPSDGIGMAAAELILGAPDLNEAWYRRYAERPGHLLEQPGAAFLYRDDLTDRLGEITAPALVIHGTADISIPMVKAEALAAGLSGSPGVTVIEGGTHASNLTRPDAVNEALLGFLLDPALTLT